MKDFLGAIPIEAYVGLVVLLTGSFTSLIIWLIKRIFEHLSNLQAYDAQNRVDIQKLKSDLSAQSDRFKQKLEATTERVTNVENRVDTHENRLDSLRSDTNTIITSHNSINCLKVKEIKILPST